MTQPAAPNVIEGEIVPPTPASPIVEYNATAAAIADLRSRYHGARYDCTTTAGLKQATAARAELRGLRVAIEAKRVELKAPVLERGKLLDSEAKRITAELVALEDPIDAQIKADEKRREEERARKAEEKRQRDAEIAQRIEWIRGRVLDAVGMRAAAIDALRVGVDGLEIVPTLYAERVNEAEEARTATSLRLQELASKAREQEAEAARLAEERAALARERERVAELAAAHVAAGAALLAVTPPTLPIERPGVALPAEPGGCAPAVLVRMIEPTTGDVVATATIDPKLVQGATSAEVVNGAPCDAILPEPVDPWRVLEEIYSIAHDDSAERGIRLGTIAGLAHDALRSRP